MGAIGSGRKTQLVIDLSAEEKAELDSWQRSTTIRASLAKRGRIVLLRAEGLPISRIAKRVGMRRRHVEKWIKRFRCERIDGLSDRKGRGRKPFFPSGGCRTPREARMRAA